jgi:hypothetical protein
MDDIFVYYHELPDGINEAVMTCSGGYTVYTDPRQSNEGIINSYESDWLQEGVSNLLTGKKNYDNSRCLQS